MFKQLGTLARKLHEDLSDIGEDSSIQRYAKDIPDAKKRLNYVAEMTEKAAHKVLASTEAASPLLEGINEPIADLKLRMDTLYNRFQLQSSGDALMITTLMQDMKQYMEMVEANTAQTKSLMTDIMMAQDFQDLTGQVIKRVTALAQDLENEILKVLVENAPEAEQQKAESFLKGPQIDSSCTESVTSQAQVDDLLDSLGF